MKIAIIGAGLSGLTASYILRNDSKNHEIYLYEKSNIVGGNCADDGTCHLYGPHTFHTNQKYIWNFVNCFCDWEPFFLSIKSFSEGEYLNVPLTKTLIDEALYTDRTPTNAEEFLHQKVGAYLTNRIYKGYSEKQWDLSLKDLPIEIVNRIPVRKNNDLRYFDDKYQGLPKQSYTKFFQQLLSASNIDVMQHNTNITHNQIKDQNFDLIIVTAAPDDFFEEKYGKLKYRNTKFKFTHQEAFRKNQWHITNYPNDFNFTRVTDYSWFYKENKYVVYGYEYPSWTEGTKTYPVIFDKESLNMLSLYQTNLPKNVMLLGRLGEFKYLNMDIAIHNVFEKLKDFGSENLKNKLNEMCL